MDPNDWFVVDAGGAGYAIHYGNGTESTAYVKFYNRKQISVDLAVKIARLLSAADHDPREMEVADG